MVVLVKTWQLVKSAELMKKLDEETIPQHELASKIIEEAAAKLKDAGIEEVMILADSGSAVG